MTHPVDVHPEDLLDREQLGVLSIEEKRRLDAHARQCAACSLVRSASVDFADERAPAADDDAMVSRIIAEALGGAAVSAAATSPASNAPTATAPTAIAPTSSPPPSGYVSSYPRRRRRAWAVAGVVMFAATGATASFWSVRHVIIQRLLFNPAASPPALAETESKATAPKHPGPKPDEAPLHPMKVDELAKPPAIEAPAATAAREPARPKAEEAPSAEDVFAAAGEARRRGDTAQAVRLYRQLQQQFPGSRPETTSRLLLARYLLDRGEDLPQALGLFTRYLEASPNGTLAEEARLGRALSLQRLGRSAEERQAWQQLLSAHPNSVHAERAKKRLDELR